jgi:phosphoglycerate dehydrogenase-like enzyme
MIKILIADYIDNKTYNQLRSITGLALVKSKSVHPTEKELEGSKILFIRSDLEINQNFIKSAPDLKHVISASNGLEHIDTEAIKNSSIKLTHLRSLNETSTAELSLILLMACARKLPYVRECLKQGNWEKSTLVGQELSGKKIGIIGLGKVGKKVALMSKAFDMIPIAYDPYIDESDYTTLGVHQAKNLAELIQESSYISIHVPLNDETNQLINRDMIKQMGPKTILINTSRGKIVDEVALYEALKDRKIYAAGLDVFSIEPLPITSPLLELGNVILTPHIGRLTDASVKRVSSTLVDSIIEAVKEVKND